MGHTGLAVLRHTWSGENTMIEFRDIELEILPNIFFVPKTNLEVQTFLGAIKTKHH
jgi:hypothetical protein